MTRHAYTTGRPVRPQSRQVRSLSDRIRQHLWDHRLTHGALEEAWGLPRSTISTLLSRNKVRPLNPKYIAATVRALRLDDFDATELYRQGAREAGYLIDGPTLED